MSGGFRIVILCGSAGALDSYIEILRKMPLDTGMAFVVLSHRRGGVPTWLESILARATGMSVESITNGTVFQADHVYICPPGMDLTTDGQAFRVVPASKTYGWPDTFDIFLRSVARTTHARALTVILSGMASDGSAAMEELQRGGGINYAQSNALETSMPRSAIRTRCVDYIGSPQEIATAILNLQPVAA
ncbi:MAG TPA: chemotaxis protein CheB [Terracidiphilus sp.]